MLMVLSIREAFGCEELRRWMSDERNAYENILIGLLGFELRYSLVNVGHQSSFIFPRTLG